jgi:Uma2 family endonuclease
VREYWLADPEADYVEVWRRAEDRFEQVGVFGPNDTFESVVLGEKAVNVSVIFERKERR